MAEQLRSLSPCDAEWDALLAPAEHDFYHRAAYHAFSERMGEGRALLLHYGSGDRFLAWPCLLRDLPGGRTDATSVYGYGGPVGHGAEDEGFRARAWAAFRGAWAEQGVVSLFTRFHPLLGNAALVRGLHGETEPEGGEVLHLGRTVSVALDAAREARRMGYPQTLRQDVKKCEREGTTVSIDPEWTHLPHLAAFYRDTMEAAEASARYRFSLRYFKALRDALGPTAHLAVATAGDRPVAALLFTIHRGIAQAHLTGTDRHFADRSPLKLLLDQSCDLARERGASRLHLGAGRGGFEDSLYAFKARFSPDRHPFEVGRWILDAVEYARLAAARGLNSNVDPGVFFPAYARPVASRNDPDRLAQGPRAVRNA